MKANLTEKQTSFIHWLFHDSIKGNVREAMNKAGYSAKASPAGVIAPLKDIIKEKAENIIISASGEAAFAMVDALRDPSEMYVKEKVVIAKELLDRSGIVKQDKLQITGDGSGGNVFFLPPLNDVKMKEIEHAEPKTIEHSPEDSTG